MRHKRDSVRKTQRIEVPAKACESRDGAPPRLPQSHRGAIQGNGGRHADLRDILAQLARPGRDPREDLPAPVFKQGVLKLEDLAPGMELTGTVLNVVDFGCFVDIGMHDSGLVHVSRLADRFIRDPHEVVAVGDIVKVWVMEVDKERRRVSLTMVRPGSERPRRPARGEGGDAAQQAPASQAQEQAGRARAGQERQQGGQGRPRVPAKGRQGRTAGQQAQQNQQGGRPQGGRPQGGRPARRPARSGPPAADRRCSAAGRRAAGRRRPRRQAARGSSRRLWRSVREDRGRKVPARASPHEFKPKPKPLIPITDAMKKGKEPMRTFGDLMQFFGSKTDDKKPPARAGRSRARSADRPQRMLPADADARRSRRGRARCRRRRMSSTRTCDCRRRRAPASAGAGRIRIADALASLRPNHQPRRPAEGQ